MIVFGTRGSLIKNIKTGNIACEHCGTKGPHMISIFGKYTHIFWIPVFPVSKKVFAECQHCKKTIDQKEFSPNLNQFYREEIQNTKQPYWQWSGLIIIAALVSLFFLIGLFAQKDLRTDMLQADVNNMSNNPGMKDDSISFKLKKVLDEFINENIDPGSFKYLTKINGDKVLFLVQIPKLSKVDKSAREDLIDVIDAVADEQKILSGKKRYIGVRGKITTMLLKTPNVKKNNKIVADDPLLEFYGDKVIAK